MKGSRLSWLDRAWLLVERLQLPWLLVGGIAAAAGERWGAYVLVAQIVFQVAAHLLVGGANYRRVMARPWPQVAAVPDDDWDD
jgi:hypothetical protein